MGRGGFPPQPALNSGISRPFYVGSYRHSLDTKNRLTIPSKWRFPDDQSMTFMALVQPSGYIMILPPAEVEKLYERISEMKFSDDEAQEFQQKFFSQAHSFSYDKQGRINLPEKLLKGAAIGREAVLVGTLTKYGIWSPDRWETVDPEKNGDNIGDLMKKVGL